MNRVVIGIAGAALAASTQLLLGQVSSEARVKNYIVVFHDDEADAAGHAASHGRAYGLAISHVYSSAMKGYAAAIPDARLDDIRRDPSATLVRRGAAAPAIGVSSIHAGSGSALSTVSVFWAKWRRSPSRCPTNA